MKIKNSWHNPDTKMYGPEFYEVGKPVFTFCDFAIYKQYDNCYLHTYRGKSIAQLGAPNQAAIKRWSRRDFTAVLDYRVEKIIVGS